ncbi:MAG TPA: acyl-CoA dehydrogenase family protein [Candidatus Eisenbacteria bacterium]
MDFSLSDDQKQLEAVAREFARDVIAPKARAHDDSGEFPLDICRQAWELGLMNVHIPEAYGGLGLTSLEGCLIAEELSAACSGIYTAIEANVLAEAPLLHAATDEQKKTWLAPMTAEFRLASYAVTEPDAGSDVSGIKTRAIRHGDDYVINGNKMWITGAGRASWFFVLAYTDPAARYQGMTGFVVPADLPGVRVGKKEENMGQRASDTRAVTFEDVTIPAANRIGAEGAGWSIAMSAFDHTRPPVASGAVGVARTALEHAVRYAQERRTFGKPIAQHQAIAFMIADMAKEVAAARHLVRHAAWLIDNGHRNTMEAAFAKCFAADTAMKVTTDAVQVFGGYGFSKEYPVEKLMRDAKVFQIYEGTSQVQRLIMAREIFKG